MVRDTVASGRLGKPNIVKVTSRDPDHQSMDYIKVSGGIFMDMTIHDFDMVRYLARQRGHRGSPLTARLCPARATTSTTTSTLRSS